MCRLDTDSHTLTSTDCDLIYLWSLVNRVLYYIGFNEIKFT